MIAYDERIARHELWRRSLVRAAAAGTLAKQDLAFLHDQLDALSTVVGRAAASLVASFDDESVRSALAPVLARAADAPGARLPVGHLDVTALVAQDLVAGCSRGDRDFSAAFLVFGVVAIGTRVRAAFGHSDHGERGPLSVAGLFDALRPFLRAPATGEAIDHALAIYTRFVDGIHLELERARSAPILERIRERKPLLDERTAVHCHAVADARTLYVSEIARLDVEFTVDRLPFDAEVVDARVVRIPKGKRSELHRHAHESLFFVIEGEGEISVGPLRKTVRQGDVVFAPRWTMHQSTNTGEGELVLLGITDFYLTSRVQVVGNGQGRLKKKESDVSTRSTSWSADPPRHGVIDESLAEATDPRSLP